MISYFFRCFLVCCVCCCFPIRGSDSWKMVKQMELLHLKRSFLATNLHFDLRFHPAQFLPMDIESKGEGCAAGGCYHLLSLLSPDYRHHLPSALAIGTCHQRSGVLSCDRVLFFGMDNLSSPGIVGDATVPACPKQHQPLTASMTVPFFFWIIFTS